MSLTVPGVDYAWGIPPYDAFKQRGIRFAMRYLSHDASKDLSVRERDALWRRGIKVGVVWETTANRALGGHDAGVTDARIAQTKVNALGLAGIPIYFAVDFDATDAQKPAVARYLDGCASVIGRARVGVYGGYWVVKYCSEKKTCAYFWQTYAWSGGHVHPHTHIYQYANGVRIGGLSCDLDHGQEGTDIGVRGPQTHPAGAEAHKKAVWRRHLATTRKQLKKLQERAAKLAKLLAR